MENREELIAKFVDDIAEHDFKAVQTVADHKTVAITVKYKEVNQVLSILLVDYRGDYRGEFPKEPVSISEGVADDVDESLLQRLGWIFNRVSILISGLRGEESEN